MPPRKTSPPSKKSGGQWKRKPKATGFDKRSYRQHRQAMPGIKSAVSRPVAAVAARKPIERKLPRVILFYKPFGVLSQFTDDQGRRTLAEFNFPKGVYSVGRLDYDSEGLLLMSDDSVLKNKLLDPTNEHPRTYLVQVERIPDEAALNALQQGVTIGGETTKPARVRLLDHDPHLAEREKPIRFRKNVPTAWIELTITEGKNRQVRRMTAAVGYPTLRLVRVKIGEWRIGEMKPGEWKVILNSAEGEDGKSKKAKGKRENAKW